ncbi:MAG TPA: polysaccharide deacetylase family protein [Thermoleophilia bacterium]|nr:polysaccharide deacetylase family protein [Thermoleophilia bacterium]
MNLDLIAAALLVAVLTLVFWVLWGFVRPHARRGWQVARVAGALVTAVVVMGAGSYWLMNSTTVQLLGDHVARVDTTRKVVALTFDDGPSSMYVNQILATLDRSGVRATFFVIGAQAKADPDALRGLVVARQEIGNHSYDHTRLVFVSTKTVAYEVEAADQVIRAAGYTGPIAFRPPYGKKLLSAPYYLWRHGRTTVMWDVAPDSIAGIAGDPRALTQYVLDNVRPGSIIELHPWSSASSATRDALPAIIAGLRADGYQFVTVSELLAPR